MGWSYTHLVLFGPDQQQVVAALADRQAAVSPTINGFTLVAAEEFESHREDRITAFGSEVSKKLGCPAMFLSEFDDDVLSYRLIKAGQIIDDYNSTPDYFDFAGKHIPPRGPQGGDAKRLCNLFGQPQATDHVDAILHRNDVLLSAPERHRQLAEALAMPSFAVGFDYGALQSGELPKGLDEFDVVFSATEPG
jgi:hypothetical protein